MRHTLTSQRGMSLMDVTVILMVMSVLSVMSTPVIGDYVSDARRVKAAEDVQVLAATFARFTYDARMSPALDRDWQHFGVLVSQGQAPAAVGDDTAAWADEAGSQRVGLLDEHLITNAPGYATAENDSAPAWARGWRGPYVNAGISADPWGRRYAINVGSRTARGAKLMVLSAGPNGIVETPFARAGFAPGGDDIIAVIGDVY